MNYFKMDYQESLISQPSIEHLAQKVIPDIERMRENFSNGYHSPYSFINVPSDKEFLHHIQTIIAEKRQLHPTLLIVIGIGGSSLGTLAVQEAIVGKWFNSKNPSIKIYFAETVDSDYIHDLVQLAEQTLHKKENIIINVVTKSGTTTETIAIFEIFLALLKQYHSADYNNYIVVTTDRSSALWDIAQKSKYTLIEVPHYVGGRFSVFVVGLFPLGMIHIDIVDLLQGAHDITPACLDHIIENNWAVLDAAIIYASYLNKITINDLFIFSLDCESIGKWYRQLMGESIGKEFDRYGNKVNRGITPTVSLGSTDLHSVGQLYLGGPYDKFITFFTIEHNNAEQHIPNFTEFEQCVAKIQGKSLSSIMHAIVQGIKIAYKNNKRPFCSITLPEKSPYFIGQFLQFEMIKMVYLGYLLELNPFDQPNVELYKKETRKILAHE